MALSTAPSEPLDAVAEADNEAAGDSSGNSGRSSPGAGAFRVGVAVHGERVCAGGHAARGVVPVPLRRPSRSRRPTRPATAATRACRRAGALKWLHKRLHLLFRWRLT